ncbi:MAG: hypothetical protein HYS12_10135 [Planctomycetes bacterium]|nr:hypothetical protein [Planctomycetota bacterium]
MIAIGITAALAAIGFGALGVYALSTPNTGLPPQFGYGMVGLAALCLLGGVACFVPSTRWWVLPLLACLIVGFVILLRVARIFRA